MDRESKTLLKWYDTSRRILPWREDPTPYHVWLSEIMLQQTRVEAVMEYYRRFLSELPDVEALAAAPEEQYLKLWEGLGYYSRIRNMHKAAVRIMEDYGGSIPSTAAELEKLPGIGHYTAAAIASIAFGQPVSSVDGNLLRVFSRMTLYGTDAKSPQAKKDAEAYFMERMPQDRPGDYNQALMDLGATVCLPNGTPHCEDCPWKDVCQAHASGRELDFPVLPPKAGRAKEQRTVFLISDGTRILLGKRPNKGLLAGLCEFPGTDGALRTNEAGQFVRDLGYDVTGIRKLPKAKHIFSHKEWHMTGYAVNVRSLDGAVPADTTARARLSSVELFPATKAEMETRWSIPSAFSAFLPGALADG